MLLLGEPDTEDVRRFLERQAQAHLSYAAAKTIQLGRAPRGFNYDHRRAPLGRGEACFARAKDAIKTWRMLDLGWARVHDPSTAQTPGTNVAIIVHVFGLWALNAARIQLVIDEPRRYGFAYGTLEDHFECGEELFLVEHGEDDTVVYDLSAFSRPHHPLVWLGYPFSRSQQKRFALDSMKAMQLATGESPAP